VSWLLFAQLMIDLTLSSTLTALRPTSISICRTAADGNSPKRGTLKEFSEFVLPVISFDTSTAIQFLYNSQQFDINTAFLTEISATTSY